MPLLLSKRQLLNTLSTELYADALMGRMTDGKKMKKTKAKVMKVTVLRLLQYGLLAF